MKDNDPFENSSASVVIDAGDAEYMVFQLPPENLSRKEMFQIASGVFRKALSEVEYAKPLTEAEEKHLDAATKLAIEENSSKRV